LIKPVSKLDEATFIRGFKARCENLSIQFRQHLKLSEVEPLPAVDLATYLGVWIWQLDSLTNLNVEAKRHLTSAEGDEWSAVTVRAANQDIIVMNPRHKPPRQSNDLMHELAHIILNHHPAQVLVSEAAEIGFRTFDKRQEAEADWLGASLLLPRPAVSHCHSQGMSVDVAAELFLVSPELYRYRLRITGVEKQQFNRLRRTARVGS